MINKVILIGYCGQSPDCKKTQNGEIVSNISVATTERYKDKSGETRESTEWHKVVFFGRLADVVREYVSKGSKVFIEGKLQTSKYQDKDGIERSITKIIGSTIKLLDRLEKSNSTASKQVSQQSFSNELEDDIPF